MYDSKAIHQIPFLVSDIPAVYSYPTTKSTSTQHSWLAKTACVSSFLNLDQYERGSFECRATDSRLAERSLQNQILKATIEIELSQYEHQMEELYSPVIDYPIRMSKSFLLRLSNLIIK